MCGRFVLAAPKEELVAHFKLDQPPALTDRYNIAPSQLVAVVAPKADPTKRGLALLKWGLVPDWSNNGKPGPINARCETVDRLATFADSFECRRCILPATAFYEWFNDGGTKRPYRFRLKGGGLFGFAGLWARWDGAADGKRLFTCCLITTAANDVVRPVHDRMPAILAPDEYDRWFDNDTPLKELKAMLRPYPAELMEAGAANPLVNSAKNEGPQLLDSVA